MRTAKGLTTVPRAVVTVFDSLLFLSLLLIGCETGGYSDGEPEFEVRDSAGIQIALNGSVGALGKDTLRTEEVLRIGEVEGEEPLLFYRIADIGMDGGGTLFVGNSQTGTVWRFALH